MKGLVSTIAIRPHYPSNTFGELIRKARVEKGLRQKDVAKATG